MEERFGSLRLSLPDGEVEITSETTPDERRKILDDLRSKYPEVLKQSPEIEGMILGTSGAEVTIEQLSTPEQQREALEHLRETMPELLRQDPRIERALQGDRKAIDELTAAGGSTWTQESLSVERVPPVPVSPPAAGVDGAAPSSAPELRSPISERKGWFARLFGRR